MEHARQSWSSLLKNGQRAWQYVLVEPFVWLFYCFFQPVRFKREFEIQGFWRRAVPMLRLALPMFLISYPLALGVQCIFAGPFPASRESGGDLSIIGLLVPTVWATVISVGWGIVGGILGDFRLGIVLGITVGIGGIVGNVGLGITKGLVVAVAAGVAGGTVGGAVWGILGGILGGLVAGIAWGGAWRITEGGMGSAEGGIEVATTFFISYVLGYYRLPLYLVSGFSGLHTYLASQKTPSQVFFHLHHSSLYWDECVFLPLPGLKKTLLLAAGQDTSRTLEEVAFIVTKRPHQIGAAQAASLEIALYDLERCESIRDIARASRLNNILSPEAALIDARWVTPFARLNDASRDAARYCGPLGWKARLNALEEMTVNLERVSLHTAFTDTMLNKRLRKVVNTWKAIIQYELEKLEQAPEKSGQIDNPYNPGQVLKPLDSLFVGRRDLVQQLAEALSKGSRRPTFLLNGERRMGKSSTLKQLPNLLGAYYLPIVYDLQVRGISSSTDVFLSTIAGEIHREMGSRGMRVKKLEHAHLKEASRKNEAEIYRLFDAWLDGLEKILEREDRTLLLIFDEFEKIEEAGHDGYLNLNLLLDWFRSTIQNRPRVALLFSGVRTFGEMAANWAGYFVNAQTLKVSFLHPSEARHLITQPVPSFPSNDIFGDGVVEQIIHVTGCHPFLIQAVCSALIEHLNADNRERAEVQDVAAATDQVLENWWDTYFRDLWERSDQAQRTCLVALRNIGEGDPKQIAQQCVLDEKIIRRTMQILLKRDLVLYEKSKYRIATPLFCEWVERNS